MPTRFLALIADKQISLTDFKRRVVMTHRGFRYQERGKLEAAIPAGHTMRFESPEFQFID